MQTVCKKIETEGGGKDILQRTLNSLNSRRKKKWRGDEELDYLSFFPPLERRRLCVGKKKDNVRWEHKLALAVETLYMYIFIQPLFSPL